MRGHLLGGAALPLLAGALSCDLFHDTSWESRCADEPSAPGCPSGGSGAGDSGGGGSGTGATAGANAGGGGTSSGGGPPDASCSDDIQNGAESDVDCGGDCRPCADRQSCVVDADCAIGVCSGGICTCGAAGERCCDRGGCGAPLACDEQDYCRILDLPNGIVCGPCSTPQNLCLVHGFAGAAEAYGYWLGQCGGPGPCPSGWAGVTCADWCSGVNCVGYNYCGPGYVVISVAAAPDTVLCASDHGGNCVGDNPGYYVRARCN